LLVYLLNRGSKPDRWRALDFTSHSKNLYAMNNVSDAFFISKLLF
jgi:hypothetical protein